MYHCCSSFLSKCVDFCSSASCSCDSFDCLWWAAVLLVDQLFSCSTAAARRRRRHSPCSVLGGAMRQGWNTRPSAFPVSLALTPAHQVAAAMRAGTRIAREAGRRGAMRSASGGCWCKVGDSRFTHIKQPQPIRARGGRGVFCQAALGGRGVHERQMSCRRVWEAGQRPVWLGWFCSQVGRLSDSLGVWVFRAWGEGTKKESKKWFC